MSVCSACQLPALVRRTTAAFTQCPVFAECFAFHSVHVPVVCARPPSFPSSPPLSLLPVGSLRGNPTNTPLVLHQLFLLLPKGVRMLPPTLLLPSPPLPNGSTNGKTHGTPVSQSFSHTNMISHRATGKESDSGGGGGGDSGQVLPRQPNVLDAQEKLGEALAHELSAARALWEPTVCPSELMVAFSHSSVHAAKQHSVICYKVTVHTVVCCEATVQ